VAIPNYESVMLPFLRVLSDGNVHSVANDVRGLLAKEFRLTDEEVAKPLPSGQQSVFQSRVGWARTYLKKAGLIEPVVRGQYRITPRGKELLTSNLARIDTAVLKQYPEFLDFIKPNTDGQVAEPEVSESLEKQTPLDVLGAAYQRLRSELADEILQEIRTASPTFFERLVLDVLVAMGYGGLRKDAGQAVGRTGDDGIDGIIKEDELGLDVVYIQAKRWTANVGRPDVQSFAGSLEGHRARKGVFITTSQFSKDAREYITRIEKKIVLIDGDRLAQYMMDFNVGVTEVDCYRVKELRRGYFDE
jgi:restriction system protein